MPVLPHVVRLYVADDGQGHGRNTWEHDGQLVVERSLKFEDREAGPCVGESGVGEDQVVGEVVKGGPSVVNHVANENRDTRGYRGDDPQDEAGVLVLLIKQTTVRVGFEILTSLNREEGKMFVRSVELRADTGGPNHR